MIDSLVTASLRNEDISFLRRFPRIVMNDVERAAFDWIIKYTSKYEHTPTVERFKKTDYGYYVNDHMTTSPLADLYDLALEDKRREYFMENFHLIESDMVEGDTLPIDKIISMGRVLSSIVEVDDESMFTIDRDDMYSEEPPNGLRFGYDVIDSATGGIQNGEYGLLVARTGVGKTLLTCNFALRWAREGKRVLVISLEMPAKQIMGRIDAMIGGFNPKVFRNRDNPALMRLKRKEVEAGLKEIKETGGDIIFPKTREVSLSKLRGIIADRAPDVVIVDGVYLLRADNNPGGANASADWQRLKAASNELKMICLELDIPIFATSQLKRTGKEEGFTLEDIAYSDALGQDTDLVLVANKFTGVANQLTLEILKNRNGDGYGGTVIGVDWDNMILKEMAWADTIEKFESKTKSAKAEPEEVDDEEALKE